MQYEYTEAAKFILRALADDYESFGTLMNYYTEPKTSSFTRSEVNQALAELAISGYVQSYSYSEIDKKFTPSKLLPDALEGLWFGLTAKGRELLSHLSE